ncbi:unnamed protein product [Enterobius vermicularis]|uniref:Transmembrane protein 231 n=1 Tax=Enterobius vermicularis TaxID=51028 RepID=A0A3P6HCZ3_ENTVE|nr:unnamed protein product [Enterobius vermicularis]
MISVNRDRYLPFKGFWKKYGEYSEQPIINFKNRFFVILNGAQEENYRVWSTYTLINQAEAGHLRIPVTEVTALDDNDDGLNDKMEVALMSEVKSQANATRLDIFGSLYLDQLVPLPSQGTFNNFDGNLMNESSTDITHYLQRNIRMRYSLRNFTTHLKRKVVIWSSPSVSSTASSSSEEGTRGFTFYLEVNIPEQRLIYRTGLFELLKWAWIQYLSLFFVLNFIVQKIFAFVIENRILPTAAVDRYLAAK